METTLDFAETTTEPVQLEPAASVLTRWPFREQIFGEIDPVAEPIVVIGAGPVGMRAVHELSRRAPHRHIVWYGAERGDPYDRVQLTSLLAGAVSLDEMTGEYLAASYGMVERRFGCPVTQIDRNARLVIDRRHRFQTYSTLILATGSTPRIPDCIDTQLPGVFTLRRLKDAKALAQRRQHSRCTVVLGGGMLGLETARAMLRTGTKVIVIEQGACLLPRQLEARASALLKEHLEALGIDILLNSEVQRVYGEDHLQGLLIAERALACDTLIVATGSDPNVEVARLAGLRVNRGIEIDDRTVTSDPNIHAIGECAEHRGRLYGVVGPGLEQARVAAANATGTTALYTGSVAVTRLKVVGMPVFSVGTGLDAPPGSGVRVWTYHSTDRNSCVRLAIRDGRLVGASGFGAAADIHGLQQAVSEQMRLRPWQLTRFLLTGSAWPKPRSAPVTQGPAEAVVDYCTDVTREPVSEVGKDGCTTLEPLARTKGVATVCGYSTSLLAEPISAAQSQASTQTSTPLRWASIAAGVLLGFSMLP